MNEANVPMPGDVKQAVVYWMNRALAAEGAQRCVSCMEYVTATSRSCSCTQYEVDHLRALMGPDYHIIDITPSGWGIQHPISCRPDLTACATHRVVVGEWGGGAPPRHGKFRLDIVDGEIRLDSDGVSI